MNKKTTVIKNYVLSTDVLYLDYKNINEGGNIDTLIKRLSSLTQKLRLLSIMKKMESAFDTGDYALSKKFAEQILVSLPDNVNALRGLGMSYFMVGDYENALVWLSNSLELSQDKEFDYTYIGWCYCNLNNHRRACEAFDKAVEINPLYEQALSGRTQAYLYLHSERLETVETLEKRLK